MAVLGYLPKLKRGLGLAFGDDFLHDFHNFVEKSCRKCAPKASPRHPFNIFKCSVWTNVQCHTLFLFQDIQQNILLSFY